MVRLSKRMEALAALVSPGEVLADVGCDHGFLSIYLVQTDVVKRAVAMDVREGPLERAAEHIAEYGCAGQIETRLSDGLDALEPAEADRILIAGMGGGLILHILERNEEKARSAEELILQPQSEITAVRRYLWQQGYRVLAEDMVEEDGKFYPMMKVSWTGGADPREDVPGRPTEADLRFGALLIRQRHPVLRRYLQREMEVQERVAAQLRVAQLRAAEGTEERSEEALERIRARYEEVLRYLALLQQTLERTEGEPE